MIAILLRLKIFQEIKFLSRKIKMRYFLRELDLHCQFMKIITSTQLHHLKPLVTLKKMMEIWLKSVTIIK